MKNNARKFLQEAITNDEIRAKVDSITARDRDAFVSQMVGIAAQHGYALKAEDFDIASDEPRILEDNELSAISGGANIWLSVLAKDRDA